MQRVLIVYLITSAVIIIVAITVVVISYASGIFGPPKTLAPISGSSGKSDSGKSGSGNLILRNLILRNLDLGNLILVNLDHIITQIRVNYHKM